MRIIAVINQKGRSGKKDNDGRELAVALGELRRRIRFSTLTRKDPRPTGLACPTYTSQVELPNGSGAWAEAQWRDIEAGRYDDAVPDGIVVWVHSSAI
jgi:hypothetical protein